jgi:hypothetical protein
LGKIHTEASNMEFQLREITGIDSKEEAREEYKKSRTK